MFLRLAPCFLLMTLLSACISSTPTAEKLDELEHKIRADFQPSYAQLEEQRRKGELSSEEYAMAKEQLDQRVQNRVDNMAWSRHALVQSDMKANAIPTPDAPQYIAPPGVGSLQGSLYNAQRQNGIGNQAMGSIMQEMGSSHLNGRRAGTLYDQ